MSILIAILLAPFLYSMTMLFPEADDFSRALAANGLFDFSGGLQEMRSSWHTWSGRFTHHFFIIFLGDAAMSRVAYSAVCLGVQGITGAALYGIFSTISSPESKSRSVFLALFCLLALQCGHTGYNLTYTLLTDALALGLGNSLVLVHIYFLCCLWFCSPNRVNIFASLSLLSAFMSAGCYEHSAIATMTASATALLLALLYRHPYRNAWILICAGTCFALALGLLAPGNFVRKGYSQQQIHFISNIWKQFSEEGLGMFSAIYMGTALTVASLLQPRWKIGLDARFGPVPVSGVGLLCIVLFSLSICGMHTFSKYSLLKSPKLAASLAYLGAFILTFLLLSISTTVKKYIPTCLRLLIPLLTLNLMCLSSNMTDTFINTAGGNIKNYALQLSAQQKILERRTGGDLAIAYQQFTPFPLLPIEPMQIPASPSIWPNNFIAKLYDYASVTRLKLSADSAYAAAKQPLPPAIQPFPLPKPLTSCTVIKDTKGSPAENSGMDWLLIRSTEPVDTLQTVVIEEPSKRRLFPVFIQNWLADYYMSTPKPESSILLKMAGISRTFSVENWRVTSSDPGYTYMLPIRVAGGKPIRAVLADWNNTAWRLE